jgi:chromate reductase
MATSIRLLGISGSLRKQSFNSAALRFAAGVLPPGVAMETADLTGIPVYNEDLRGSGGFPAAVQRFREQIAAADGLLIVTPEYNYSVPGPLKNAIDWASRPPEQPFDGKPIAIMGASPGMLGSARAQYHLRQVFVYLNGLLVNRPEVMIGAAHTKFDEQGELHDETAKKLIGELLAALVNLVQLVRKK